MGCATCCVFIVSTVNIISEEIVYSNENERPWLSNVCIYSMHLSREVIKCYLELLHVEDEWFSDWVVLGQVDFLLLSNCVIVFAFVCI